jgi:hypothetical protein
MSAKRSLSWVILVVTLIVTGFAVASNRRGAKLERERSQLERSELVREIQVRQLPREWVWKKKAITFDDMYRR